MSDDSMILPPGRIRATGELHPKQSWHTKAADIVRFIEQMTGRPAPPHVAAMAAVIVNRHPIAEEKRRESILEIRNMITPQLSNHVGKPWTAASAEEISADLTTLLDEWQREMNVPIMPLEFESLPPQPDAPMVMNLQWSEVPIDPAVEVDAWTRIRVTLPEYDECEHAGTPADPMLVDARDHRRRAHKKKIAAHRKIAQDAERAKLRASGFDEPAHLNDDAAVLGA